jgi:hypothetical protein
VPDERLGLGGSSRFIGQSRDRADAREMLGRKHGILIEDGNSPVAGTRRKGKGRG